MYYTDALAGKSRLYGEPEQERLARHQALGRGKSLASVNITSGMDLYIATGFHIINPHSLILQRHKGSLLLKKTGLQVDFSNMYWRYSTPSKLNLDQSYVGYHAFSILPFLEAGSLSSFAYAHQATSKSIHPAV